MDTSTVTAGWWSVTDFLTSCFPCTSRSLERVRGFVNRDQLISRQALGGTRTLICLNKNFDLEQIIHLEYFFEIENVDQNREVDR